MSEPQRPKLPTFWVEVTPRQRLAAYQAVMHPRFGADRKAGARLMRYLSLGVIRDALELHGRVSPTHLVGGPAGWVELDTGCVEFLEKTCAYEPKDGDAKAPPMLHALHSTALAEVGIAFGEGIKERHEGAAGIADTIENWSPTAYEEQLTEAKKQIAELLQALERAQK